MPPDLPGWGYAEPSGTEHQPVSAAARRQPGGLVEVGDEALAAASERDVPVLLSVAYAACHGIPRLATVGGKLRNRRSAA